MDSSLPGSSVHGIFQARILEWEPFPSPGDLPNSGIKPGSPTLQADSLPSETLGKPNKTKQNIIARSHSHRSAINIKGTRLMHPHGKNNSKAGATQF